MTYFDLPFWAYLDPLTGSLLLQVLAAFLIGAGVMLRKYLFAPVAWLFRCRGSREQESQGDLYE